MCLASYRERRGFDAHSKYQTRGYRGCGQEQVALIGLRAQLDRNQLEERKSHKSVQRSSKRGRDHADGDHGFNSAPQLIN
jgi:hypothetical protein